MFWQKKRINRAQCPPVESIDDFVEWLLKYSDDFEEFRDAAQASLNRYVRNHSKLILQELGAQGDEESLAAYIDAGCDDYAQNYQNKVYSAGGFQNLPSHIHEKAFHLLLKLRVMMYVLHHRYGSELSAPMLAASGPLQSI